MDDLRALTVQRPWSSLIAHHTKRVENRTWVTSHRGPLLIHAGQGWDPTARWFAQELVLVGSTYWTRAAHPTGIVAVADLTGVCEGWQCQCGPWAAPGLQHWRLGNVRPLAEPVPARGQLSLWRPSAGVVAAVLDQVEVSTE